MDERIYEQIDKYLRKEMTPEESLNFEQEALNNPELRKEIELTYRIKRSLIDRKEKLRKTAQWERKSKFKIASFATISSIAAMLVVGFFITKPALEVPDTNGNLIASASIESPNDLKEIRESAIVTVKKSISKGMEEEAIAEVNRLEEKNVIPTLNEISEGRFVMSNSMGSEDAEILSRDAYELHWLKIQSLLAIGQKAEAKEQLKSFIQIEGKYKATADSLLHTLN